MGNLESFLCCFSLKNFLEKKDNIKEKKDKESNGKNYRYVENYEVLN